MLQIKIQEKTHRFQAHRFALRPAIGPTYEVFYFYLKGTV